MSSTRTGRLHALLGRVTRLELFVTAVLALVMVILVVAEPAILEAPFENRRTVVFTFGGTALAAVVLLVMLRLRIPGPIRIVVLGAPLIAVTWWLVSPYFIDEVVHDDFATSIADAAASGTTSAVPTTLGPPSGSGTVVTTVPVPATTAPSAPARPVLLGAGRIRGLAGHEGEGDAGFFRLEGGAHVLRLENFDIQNGPDLRLYVVRGADRRSPVDGSLYLGRLRGNVGEQTYELPADFTPSVGDWTVLVWCEAFDVEFVAATVTVS